MVTIGWLWEEVGAEDDAILFQKNVGKVWEGIEGRNIEDHRWQGIERSLMKHKNEEGMGYL